MNITQGEIPYKAEHSIEIAVEIPDTPDVLVIQVSLQRIPPSESLHAPADHRLAFIVIRLLRRIAFVVFSLVSVDAAAHPLVIITGVCFDVTFEIGGAAVALDPGAAFEGARPGIGLGYLAEVAIGRGLDVAGGEGDAGTLARGGGRD